MSIAQRSNGRWIVKFKDAATGVWRQKSFKDKLDALAFDEEITYDKKENERLTLGDAVAAFMTNVPHVRRTVEDYSFLVNGRDRKDGTHTEGPAEFIADKYCTELTRRDLENCRLRMRERGQSITTINNHVFKLKAALNWAVEQELIPANPWAKYKSLPGARQTASSRKGTLEDFMKVYPRLPPWMQWACRTAMALCLRPGISELFSLKWAAFDWRSRTVTVYMPKVDMEKVVYPPNWYLNEAFPRFEDDTAAGYEIVCRNARNKALTETYEYRPTWVHHCRKAGVAMPFYAIRHIAASEMLAAGVDLASVAAQLGHSNPSTTASFYTHAIAAAQRRAGDSLPVLHHMVRDGARIKG